MHLEFVILFKFENAPSLYLIFFVSVVSFIIVLLIRYLAGIVVYVINIVLALTSLGKC